MFRLNILLILFTLTIYVSASSDIYEEFPTNSTAQWIWTEENKVSGRWVAFRKIFMNDSPFDTYIMSIAVDSKYWLWINDKLVVYEGGMKRGPNRNDGFYDSIDITSSIQPGKNLFSILVWYFGRSSSSHVSSGQSGLIFTLNDDILVSDNTWKVMPMEAYQDDVINPSVLLSEPNVFYNASRAIENWQSVDFIDDQWPNAKEYGGYPCQPWNQLWKHNIPQWYIGPIIEKTGSEILFIKNMTKEEIKTEYVMDVDEDYVHYMIHLPRNIQYTPYIHVISSSNKVLFLDPEIKKITIEVTHSAKYITKEGDQKYESLGWLNGQTAHFIVPQSIQIVSFGYRESRYNSDFSGTFECNDLFYNQLWEKSRNSLIVTVRDNFMDCPDRERTHWTGDQVIESRMAFYVTDPSLYPLIRKGILITQDWSNEDHVIPTVAPSPNWIELPAQSLAGIYGAYLYTYYTKDLSVLKHGYIVYKGYVLNQFNMSSNGLIEYRHGQWDWIDWGDHIDSYLAQTAWYAYILQFMIKICILIQNEEDIVLYQQRVDSIQIHFHDYFWNNALKAYKSPDYNDEVDERGNALAIIANLVPNNVKDSILHFIYTMKHSSPYMENYVLESLLQNGYIDEVLERMKDRYTEMVSFDYSTLWEFWTKETGTLNHGWSGGSVYLFPMYIAGVKPTRMGYDSYDIKPNLGSLTKVNSRIHTIKGVITININKQIINNNETESILIELKSIPDSLATLYLKSNKYTLLKINNISLQLVNYTPEELSEFEKNTSTAITTNDGYILITMNKLEYTIAAQ
ncbi:hypothetical protein WA158_005256 [Blastocystis sp. Blastoise]